MQMKYKVVMSKLAFEDLYQVRRYIDCVLNSPIAAKRIYNEIKQKILSLKENPKIYIEERDTKLIKTNTRKVVVKNIIIFYEFIEEDKVVNVLRIVNGRINWK